MNETDTAPSATKQIAIRVTETTWRRIRMLAAARDTSAQDVASKLIEKYLTKEERS